MTSTAALRTIGTATSTATGTTGRAPATGTTSCPFQERFGRRLPRGFAEHATGMDWRTLLDTFAPSSDRFHLADFTRRPLGRGITAYEAILATRGTSESPRRTSASSRGEAESPGDFTAHRLTTRSCGDLTAMSDMLGQIGTPVEVERFHQYDGPGFGDAQSWCTILRATSGRRETWALGFGENPSEASIAALLSAATLLHLR